MNTIGVVVRKLFAVGVGGYATASAIAMFVGCGGQADDSALGNTSEPIVGGVVAAAGFAPYEVEIRTAGGGHLCGGAIVADSISGGSGYVVTAAHCVAGADPKSFVITAGEHDTSVSEGTEQVRTSADVIVHGNWNPQTFENDIALIRLSSPVTFNQWVAPIAMPDGRYDPQVMATASGWGSTLNGPTTVMMKVDLPIVDQATCAGVMNPYLRLQPTMLCAGYSNTQKGTCFGDSGGPLTAKNGAGQTQLVGITSWGEPYNCSQYSVFTRVVDFVPWIREITLGQPIVCEGQTPPGYTNWQPYGADNVFVDVDTSQCDFYGTTQYFTSLGGTSLHYLTQGATSIYTPTETGFRVYVNKPGITPEQANASNWNINWHGVPLNETRYELCSGRTTPGSTNWTAYGTQAVYVDVDTSRCGNTATTPRYFTSLGGTSNHWTTVGVTNIYSPTPTTFRVYVVQAGITPQIANSRSWHVNWEATPATPQPYIDQCTGSTPAGAGWTLYAADTITLAVDTTSCQRSVSPLYFTSLGGLSSHYTAAGITSIYQPTPQGFRVYLKQSGITPNIASTRQYLINWAAYR